MQIILCVHKMHIIMIIIIICLQWDDDEEHPESSVSSVWIQVPIPTFISACSSMKFREWL
jgi:hypothetical protein